MVVTIQGVTGSRHQFMPAARHHSVGSNYRSEYHGMIFMWLRRWNVCKQCDYRWILMCCVCIHMSTVLLQILFLLFQFCVFAFVSYCLSHYVYAMTMTGYCWATQLGPFWNFQTFQLVLDLNIGKLPWDRRQTKRCGKPLEKPVGKMIYIHLWWVFHICVSWPEGIDTTKATMWIGKHLQTTCELRGTRLQTMSTHVGRQVASFNLTQKQYPSSAGWWILSSCTVFFHSDLGGTRIQTTPNHLQVPVIL